MAFVDLEKAFDTVPRKMEMATLRWMGAPESEVKMVEAMYENTTGRVVVGSGMSNEFQVNIGLRQRSALSKPIAFHLSNGTNQQEDKHNRCSEEDMYSEHWVSTGPTTSQSTCHGGDNRYTARYPRHTYYDVCVLSTHLGMVYILKADIIHSEDL